LELHAGLLTEKGGITICTRNSLGCSRCWRLFQLPLNISTRFKNPALPTEERVSNILRLMTLDEKTAALRTSTAVPRLGIPDAGSSEGLHGLVQRPLPGFGPQNAIPTTQFAQVVGMAQTWDKELIHRAGEIQGIEARFIYNNRAKYKKTPLIVWGPNADIARDPRWGRIDETYGEDPFFNGTMAAAFAKGIQGDDPENTGARRRC